MIRHERLRPPSRDYPADEWSVVEKAFHPEFLAQLETIVGELLERVDGISIDSLRYQAQAPDKSGPRAGP